MGRTARSPLASAAMASSRCSVPPLRSSRRTSNWPPPSQGAAACWNGRGSQLGCHAWTVRHSAVRFDPSSFITKATPSDEPNPRSKAIFVPSGDQEMCCGAEKLPNSRTGVPEGELRSEEHTSELQSLRHLVCRLLLEKKKN